MSSRFLRTDRIGEMMQRKLAEIIRVEVKDPRLPSLVTISAVQVSRDLSHAKVYFTVYDGDPELTTVILNATAPYLRKALARTIQTRTVPQLHFIFDESIQYGTRLSRLIDKLNPPHSLDADDSSAE
jgi:ribosome-binding factor A